MTIYSMRKVRLHCLGTRPNWVVTWSMCGVQLKSNNGELRPWLSQWSSNRMRSACQGLSPYAFQDIALFGIIRRDTGFVHSYESLINFLFLLNAFPKDSCAYSESLTHSCVSQQLAESEPHLSQFGLIESRLLGVFSRIPRAVCVTPVKAYRYTHSLEYWYLNWA
jgi:hypothetical protein